MDSSGSNSSKEIKNKQSKSEKSLPVPALEVPDKPLPGPKSLPREKEIDKKIKKPSTSSSSTLNQQTPIENNTKNQTNETKRNIGFSAIVKGTRELTKGLTSKNEVEKTDDIDNEMESETNKDDECDDDLSEGKLLTTKKNTKKK